LRGDKHVPNWFRRPDYKVDKEFDPGFLGKWSLISWVRVAGFGPAAIAVALLSLNVFVPAGLAIATGQLVRSVLGAAQAGNGDVSRVISALAVLCFLLLLEQVLRSIQGPARSNLAASIDGRLRERLRTILSSPSGIAHLEDQNVRDDAHRITRGVTGRTLGQGSAAQLATFFYMAGALVSSAVAAIYAPELAAFVLAAMLFQRWILYEQVSGYVQMSSSLTGGVRRGKYWIDVAGGPATAKEIRLFGLSRWAVERQFDLASQARRPAFEAIDHFNKMQWIPFATALIGYGVPFAVLAWRAASGSIAADTLSIVLPALIAIGYFGSPGFDMFDIQAAIPCAAAMRRLEQLGATATSGEPLPPAGATISFEGVSFTYPGAQDAVLADLDLEIPAGGSIAIVGANGAGKTTLVKLLCRLYEPTGGRIAADGTDIASVDADEWRRRISVIFQDFVHYELTASDNIGTAELGRVDQQRVERAAADADATDIVAKLASGWDTTVSRAYSAGAELSGGQWQRIALARLLYGLHAGREILILDEPTANLDVEAEIELFDRLLERTNGKTVILVSHRFSTVRRADRIVVIDRGKVVEQGTHTELLALVGMYSEMFHAQADRYETSEATT
jgi:ATP-binding cassette subfamily B protein